MFALTVLGGIMSSLVGVWVAGQIEKAESKVGAEVIKQGAPMFYELLYRGDAIVAERVAAAPPSTVVTAWTSVWLCPLLVALVGFDAISAERQHRSVRYYTVRVRRPVYFVGKWLGLWLICSIVLLLTQLISWLCDLALVHNPADKVFTWGPALYLVTLPILAAWTAVASFLGSLVRTPMIALLLIFGVFGVLWVLGNLPIDDMYHSLLYPSSLDHFLLRTDGKSFGIGLGACLAFPAVFVSLGSYFFSRAEV